MSVSQVHASDVDGSTHPHGKRTYSLYSSDSSGNFSIDAVTGVIRTAAILDYEAQPVHTLIAIATEQCGENSANVTVTVNLNDINDNSPQCSTPVFRSKI